MNTHHNRLNKLKKILWGFIKWSGGAAGGAIIGFLVTAILQMTVLKKPDIFQVYRDNYGMHKVSSVLDPDSDYGETFLTFNPPELISMSVCGAVELEYKTPLEKIKDYVETTNCFEIIKNGNNITLKPNYKDGNIYPNPMIPGKPIYCGCPDGLAQLVQNSKSAPNNAVKP